VNRKASTVKLLALATLIAVAFSAVSPIDDSVQQELWYFHGKQISSSNRSSGSMHMHYDSRVQVVAVVPSTTTGFCLSHHSILRTLFSCKASDPLLESFNNRPPPLPTIFTN